MFKIKKENIFKIRPNKINCGKLKRQINHIQLHKYHRIEAE